MKKMLLIGAVAAMSLAVGPLSANAQGPAGAGAGAAASESSHSAHSYNPLKWVKRGSAKAAGDQLDANGDQDKRLTDRLRQQGLLAQSVDAKDACATFKELGDCVAALHASHKLGMDFNCVKSDMTNVQASADMSSCKGPGKDKALNLVETIRLLKPDADAKAEAKEAEKQAKEDLKQTKG